MKPSKLEACGRITKRFPLPVYIGSIIILIFLIGWALLAKAQSDGLHGWKLVLPGILSLLAVSQLSISLVNWLVTILSKPSMLPKMTCSTGIPAEYRTMVVIPAMLTS